MPHSIGPRGVRRWLGLGAAALAALSLAIAACNGPSGGDFSGSIEVDGSSTVYPISEAVAEEFRYEQPRVRVTVGISGTGGGFQKFCNGETAVSNASRPIKQSETDRCAAEGIDFIELPVAFDAISVVVNPENDWATCITTEELRTIWEPAAQGEITRWNQVRPEWPDEPLRLFGAGTDSGTFDYFTEAIVGEEDASRGDFTASEDDNVLVQGVSGDRHALGYFGLAYYLENNDKVRAVQVDGGQGCVSPSVETVEDGTYRPLSRPLFIYVRADEAERPEVDAFVDFYLANAGNLAEEVGFVRFPENIARAILARWETRTTGTAYTGDVAGKTVEQALPR